MIKDSELRIGNYVEYTRIQGRINPIIRLLSVGNNYLDVKYTLKQSMREGVGNCMFSEIDSILLTEEWLLKFGFIEDVRKVFFKGIIDVERILSDSPDWEVHIHGKSIGKSINCVHQIQNFYYALTGEELELKVRL
ncbi:hypothetical protein [Chitinophaga sp. MM2321]|uniref:hypothetical protein n=1 Tax=Chitinophaga sp. MM2321 TaxID=3137178 RepID=UPI0032D56AAD